MTQSETDQDRIQSLASLHRKELSAHSHLQQEMNHIQIREGAVPYLTSPLLDEQSWMIHGFTTRLGGVSEGGLASLNLSYALEKNRARTDENFRRLAKSAGFDPEDMVLSFQTHTTNLRVVTQQDRGKGFSQERDYEDIDGLVTDVPGLVLVTFYGDCVPLLAADPVRRVIGSAHSGWKGTLNNIARELIRTMQEQYGCRPEDILASIGPSICSDCFEVDADVAEQFLRSCQDRPYIRNYVTRDFRPGKEHKYHIDLQEICRGNLLDAGLTEDHISLPDLCTCCNPDLLFSHRGSRGDHGLMAAFMSIRSRD